VEFAQRAGKWRTLVEKKEFSSSSPAAAAAAAAAAALCVCLCVLCFADMVGYDLQSVPQQKPAWLEALLSEKFFVACTTHAALKKNEKNVFCVDCSGGVCQHCVSGHRSHCLLQIRRYVYHDVIRLQDIQRLLDCSEVQTYIINSARVVFLNQRPQPRPSKGLGNACGFCERSLQDSYHYCSVGCKVDAVMRQGRDLSSLLPGANLNNTLPYSFFPCLKEEAAAARRSAGEKLDSEEEEEEELLTDSPFDDTLLPVAPTSSNEIAATTTAPTAGAAACATATSSTTTSTLLMPKKIRTGRLPGLSASPKSLLLPVSTKRRKGIPQRSPVC